MKITMYYMEYNFTFISSYQSMDNILLGDLAWIMSKICMILDLDEGIKEGIVRINGNEFKWHIRKNPMTCRNDVISLLL